jgi:hypothetical protein
VLKPLAAILALGVASVVLLHGTGPHGARELVRWTARSSVALLCLAFVADGVRGSFFAWRKWADLLRSLALSHTVHAVAVAALAVHLGGVNLVERSSPLDVLGGALAYVFLFWAAWKPYSRTASLGLFWVWGVFMVSYGTRAWRMPVPFAVPVALLLLAMAVRLSRLFRAAEAAGAHSALPAGTDAR